MCASTERRASRGGARRRESGECGPWEERGPQVPLYLESPEAEYIPTYLPSTCPLSLSRSCPLSLFFLPSRPIASPPPTSHPRAPSRPPRRPGACVSYTAGSPRHDARHRATTGTDQWFVSPRRRRASRRRRRSLSLFFFSSSLPLSLLCHPVARARNFTEGVHSSCWLLLVLEARTPRGSKILQTCVTQSLDFSGLVNS